MTGQGPILIAGQTASGKSALALEWARRVDGVVVNADSMQVYNELRILTARPSSEEMRGVPHYLYGHVAGEDAYSVGRWLRDMETLLAQLRAERRIPVIVGGTGLYFKALIEGLSPIPEIPAEIREKWRSAAADPAFDLHAALASRDRETSNRLDPGDRHRIARALEVIDATGKPFGYWLRRPECGLVSPQTATKLVVTIDRQELYRRCDRRFDLMMTQGALDEVECLLARNLSPSLPVMRALGVRPLASYLGGETSLEQAVERGKTETRQYAKRQMTWLRSNMITWTPHFAQ